ncbi:hypothetical protein [Gallaecimonas sp. GXIMD1310]|uniref:hypothetical protein n=1 Tax=Gallaecimonas sp. GXIMD1310 TaxID=3131926 RepID=UPI0032522F09
MDLAKFIDETISGKDAAPEPLNAEEQAFAAEFNNADSRSGELDKLRFKCVIRKSGRCGFASGGSIDYVVNTDPGASYTVTVRTHWRQGINSGQYDRVYNLPAGYRKQLGCTDSGAIPVAYYNRSVVGEERS